MKKIVCVLFLAVVAIFAEATENKEYKCKPSKKAIDEVLLELCGYKERK